MHALLNSLTERLVDELKLWKQKQKLKYAELYAEVNKKDFAPWYVRVHEVI